jgi:Holliday junction resolvasome RuvABC endonuclease subunit
MLLALDVGFRNMGWVVISRGKILKCGVLTTEKTKRKGLRVSDDNAYRCAILAVGIANLLHDNNIDGVVAEAPHGGARNARAMAAMAMSTAIVASVCALRRMPIEWSTPSEGKVALTGKKTASKEEMMEAARKLFPKAPFPKVEGKFEHIADAVGSYKALENANLSRMYG